MSLVIKQEVFMDIFAYRIMPVIQIEDAADAQPLGEALMAGGLPVAEVTFRTDAAAESIAIMNDIEGFTVGAGTVITPSQVELAIEAGAKFLVSPGLRTDVVREAQLAGRPIIPGAVTPGEIMSAQALGIDTVKFFPAKVFGGPAAISTLAAAFTTMKFIPTGGIDGSTMPDYLKLSCVPAVAGSWVALPHLIAAKDFAAVTAACREALSQVAALA